MPYLPSSENTESSYTTDRRNPRTAILKSLHGHNAHAAVLGYKYIVQGRCSLILLAGVGDVTKGKRSIIREMDITRHHLLMGTIAGNCYRQRTGFLTGAKMVGEELPHQTHQDFRIQLKSERTSRTVTFRSQGSNFQGSRRKPVEMVSHCIFGILGRTRNYSTKDGLFAHFAATGTHPLLRSISQKQTISYHHPNQHSLRQNSSFGEQSHSRSDPNSSKPYTIKYTQQESKPQIGSKKTTNTLSATSISNSVTSSLFETQQSKSPHRKNAIKIPWPSNSFRTK